MNSDLKAQLRELNITAAKVSHAANALRCWSELPGDPGGLPSGRWAAAACLAPSGPRSEDPLPGRHLGSAGPWRGGGWRFAALQVQPLLSARCPRAGDPEVSGRVTCAQKPRCLHGVEFAERSLPVSVGSNLNGIARGGL